MTDFESLQEQLAIREADLRRQLDTIRGDGDLEHRREKLDSVFAKLKELYRECDEPIRNDLAGLNLETDKWGHPLIKVPDFARAVPVLLTHLRKPYLPRIREHIARRLATPVAKDAWNDLVELYTREPAWDPEGRKDAKDGLAAALAETATQATLEELIKITRDTSHGSSRLLLLAGIRRFRTDSAKQALESFVDDEDLKIEVAEYKKQDEAQRKKREKELEHA